MECSWNKELQPRSPLHLPTGPHSAHFCGFSFSLHGCLDTSTHRRRAPDSEVPGHLFSLRTGCSGPGVSCDCLSSQVCKQDDPSDTHTINVQTEPLWN